MSSTFSFNAVRLKVELCKCLWNDRVVICDVNESLAVKVLRFVVMLEQGVGHLQLQ